MDALKQRASGLRSRIVFPEAEDDRIMHAVKLASRSDITRPLLMGRGEVLAEKAAREGIPKAKFDIVDPEHSPYLARYARMYSRMFHASQSVSEKIMKNTLFMGAMSVAAGDAQGLIAGAVYTSAELISVSRSIIGLHKGFTMPSSFFIMSVPGYAGGNKGVLIFADCSVNPSPCPNALADTAIATCQSARRLLRWTPRAAMLSFSTKGSASHAEVEKVTKAVEIAKRREPKLMIDGELQADAALVMSTAKRKMGGKLGPVAGRANILIFPDLDAGNIAYKLVNILAGANAYGPILQGFAKPVSDLSRGATPEDIVGAITVLSILIGGAR